jgi:hypothetical protein
VLLRYVQSFSPHERTESVDELQQILRQLNGQRTKQFARSACSEYFTAKSHSDRLRGKQFGLVDARSPGKITHIFFLWCAAPDIRAAFLRFSIRAAYARAST